MIFIFNLWCLNISVQSSLLSHPAVSSDIMKIFSDRLSLSTYLSFSSFQHAVEGLECAALKSARQPASH